jgi:outer membrane protein
MNKPFPVFLAAVAAVAGTAAAADNTATLMMPDGSRDMYVGAAVATRTAAGDGERRATALRPLFQIQWSNGIFARPLASSACICRDAGRGIRAAAIAASNARNPRDGRRLRAPMRSTVRPMRVAFITITWGQYPLLVNAVYDTSAHGLRGQFGVQKTCRRWRRIHTVSVSASVALAASPVMRELYEVS